jgi:hypothetical protein
MKTLALAAAVALLAAACRKPAAPAASGAGAAATSEYAPADGAYSCRVPSKWRVDEEDSWGPSVSFLDPSDGKPYSHSLSIVRYPSKVDDYTTVEKYLRRAVPKDAAVEKTRDGGRVVYRYHLIKPFLALNNRTVLYQERTDVILLPVQGGFYRLSHAAPESDYRRTLPAFEALVESFRPKS